MVSKLSPHPNPNESATSWGDTPWNKYGGKPDEDWIKIENQWSKVHHPGETTTNPENGYALANTGLDEAAYDGSQRMLQTGWPSCKVIGEQVGGGPAVTIPAVDKNSPEKQGWRCDGLQGGQNNNPGTDPVHFNPPPRNGDDPNPAPRANDAAGIAKDIEKTLDDLGKQIDDLQFELAKGGNLDERELKKKLDDLEKQIHAAQRKLDHLREQLSDKAPRSLEMAIDKLERQIDNAEAQIDRLQELTNGRGEVDLDKLKEGLQRLERTTNQAKGQLDNVQDGIDRHQAAQKQRKLENAMNDLEAGVDSAEEKIDQLQDELSKTGWQTQALREKLQTLEKQIHGIQQELDSLRAQADPSQIGKQIEALEKGLDSAQKHLDDLQKTAPEGLKAELASIEKDLNAAEGHLDAIRDLVSSQGSRGRSPQPGLEPFHYPHPDSGMLVFKA